MHDYERKSVSETIDGLNNKIFLPDIQRPFVWEPEQIYTLFDSIMRDYPISTLLFWRLDGKYLDKENIEKREFVKVNTDRNISNKEISHDKEYFLVLDGQQRLTAFFLVLKGSYILNTKKNIPCDLYFNVVSGKEEIDGIQYEFEFFPQIKGAWFKDKAAEMDRLWYRVKDIYAMNPVKLFTELPKIASHLTSETQITLVPEQLNNISKLCSALKTDKIIYYYPESEKDYEKVLDIFVRTNSGGTPLSYSDLLFSTIISSWPDARKNFQKLLDNVNGQNRYKFSVDNILKSALVANGKSIDGIKYKTKNFRSDLIKKLESDWKKFERAITITFDLLQNKLFLSHDKTVSSYNSLIPIIYWVYRGGHKGLGSEKGYISDAQISAIRLWLITSLMSGVFGGQSDTILYKCKEAIDADTTGSFPVDAIAKKINTETKKKIGLGAGYLDGISHNSRTSYLVLSICYQGAVNFQPRYSGNLPEQDHIFSKRELKEAKIPKTKINSICNLRYIGGNENKTKSDTPYAEWRATQTDSDLQRHLIPAGEWSVANFDAFLAAREELIKRNFASMIFKA